MRETTLPPSTAYTNLTPASHGDSPNCADCFEFSLFPPAAVSTSNYGADVVPDDWFSLFPNPSPTLLPGGFAEDAAGPKGSSAAAATATTVLDTIDLAAAAPIGVDEESSFVLQHELLAATAPPAATTTTTTIATTINSSSHTLGSPRRSAAALANAGPVQSSPAAGISPRKRDRPLPPVTVSDPADPVAVKRARNTLAARKSRQKKVEHVDELERTIKDLIAERDYWKSLAQAHGLG
jgi:hypothetical protein